MKQSSDQTLPAAPRRRRRRPTKNQVEAANMGQNLQINEQQTNNTEKIDKIDFQVGIAYTQPRRHRPAFLPEERLLCELRHQISQSKNIAPFGGMEVVGYDLHSEDKPYFSGGGFFVQHYSDKQLIAWRMGVYETFCLGLHTMPSLLSLLENICENAQSRMH